MPLGKAGFRADRCTKGSSGAGDGFPARDRMDVCGRPRFLFDESHFLSIAEEGGHVARLTDYLLKLAQDPDELKKFRDSKESATESMNRAELKDEHKQLLVEGNWVGIHRAINSEFADTAMPAGGNSCTFGMSLTLTKNW